jgi:dihydroneopterin aldolase
MAAPLAAGHDIISVKNLQLPFGVVAPDVWGKPKEQPALVTITLVLKNGFSSAASKDELDNSTIHYGELSKRIRNACAVQGQTAGHVSSHVERAIRELGTKKTRRDVDGSSAAGGSSFIVGRSVVEVNLPKASMYGDGVALSTVSEYDHADKVVFAQRVFMVKDVKIMTLVGVNAYERTAKQPLVASLWVYLGDEKDVGSEGTVALFNMEQTLVQVCHTEYLQPDAPAMCKHIGRPCADKP